MKKFLIVLLAGSLALACGKGKEAKEEEEGTDDQALQTSATSATTATSAAATAPAVAISADAATITGTVKLTAAAPAMPALQMSADPYCASQHASAPAKDEEVVAGPGGELENVFVYIKQINGSFPPSTTPVVIDQRGCQYHPHVLAVQVGQPLQIKNSDNALHNIHALPIINSQFNEGQPVQGMVSTKKFDKPEIMPFKVKCDVHGWMKAWMAVMPHPFYAVSQANGSYTISNLPPGNYTLVAWHEKYGAKEQQIAVAAKESKAVNFTF
ncbi:MAG TPA: carboxypeptidase regulatory-like domain-containing protein [Thermoanaerobaculia bacterium]|nr:carboxypeptidase regulatory-like domain-containing protein [Thermoanaerobaculia bacterium]